MSFDPGWSFDNYTWEQTSGTGGSQTQTGPPNPIQPGPSHLFPTNAPPYPGPPHQTRAPYPVQTPPPRPFLAGSPPIYQTGTSHLIPTGPLNYFQTFLPPNVLSEAPHPFQAGPHLFQLHPQPFQSQTPPPYQAVQNVYLTEPSHPFRTGAQRRPATFVEPPRQRVIKEITTSLASPSLPPSQLRIMESAESSPERQNSQKSHAELLQAFQNFKPAGRAPSKTPQPPSTSRTQRSSTPATNAGQAIKAGMTAFELESPSTAPSTQKTTTTTTRKRARRTPYTEQTEDQDFSNSDAPPSQTVKRPRQTPAKTSDKQQASTIPKHVVEEQIHNDLARMEQVAQRSLQHIDSTIQGEQGRASMTPEVAANSIEGVQGQRLQYQNSDSLFVPQTVQSSKAFATQLLKENQKFAEQLSQKNGTFLRSMPSTAVSYLEAKLAKVTDEMTRLHQEKVDAIRLEYVAELQRDMDERQKVIDMLLQKPDA